MKKVKVIFDIALIVFFSFSIYYLLNDSIQFNKSLLAILVSLTVMYLTLKSIKAR